MTSSIWKPSFFDRQAPSACATEYPFSRNYIGHINRGASPLARHNQWRTRISLIDTRDLGRAMVWLGALTEAANEVYLGKGFDVCWHDLQEKFDEMLGSIPQRRLPPAELLYAVATVAEWLWPPPKIPFLMRHMVLSLTHDVVIDDSKLKHTGFQTRYVLDNSFRVALDDIREPLYASGPT